MEVMGTDVAEILTLGGRPAACGDAAPPSTCKRMSRSYLISWIFCFYISKMEKHILLTVILSRLKHYI